MTRKVPFEEELAALKDKARQIFVSHEHLREYLISELEEADAASLETYARGILSNPLRVASVERQANGTVKVTWKPR